MKSRVTKLLLVLAVSLPILLNAAQTKQKVFRFDTPWLGVEISDVSVKTLKNMGLDNGIRISKVYDNSPAKKAKLEIDDIIVIFDGEKVKNLKDLKNLVKMKKVNEEVELEYFRDGKMNSTNVKIEKRKSPQIFMNKKPHIIKEKFHHSRNSVFLGVKVESLTAQLRKYFNVSEGLGVLISEVVEDSPAEKAGLKAGDVITKVEDREVKNHKDLVRGLNYFDPTDEVEIYFVRDKSKKSVDVKLAEPQHNIEKMMWMDDNEFIHDFDIDIHDLHDIDENVDEIEMKLDELDKKIKIKKEIRIKNET